MDTLTSDTLVTDIINKLCIIYCFDISEAHELLGYKYNVGSTTNNNNTDNNNNNNTNNNPHTNISVSKKSKMTDHTSQLKLDPFNGTVYDDQCKAIVFNHGLYTQCKKNCTTEFCSTLCKKIKYGHINTRKNYPVGTYVLPNGKKEVRISILTNRLKKKESVNNELVRPSVDDSDGESLKSKDDILEKSKRGRPKQPDKKITYIDDTNSDIVSKTSVSNSDNEEDNEYESDNVEEILVKQQTINGILCYVSETGTVYDISTQEEIVR
jgi:hypothetical protein